MPEIPPFRTVRHSGHAVLETYLINEDSGTLIEKGARATAFSTSPTAILRQMGLGRLLVVTLLERRSTSFG